MARKQVLASAMAGALGSLSGWFMLPSQIAGPNFFTDNAPVINNTRGTKQHQRQMQRKRAQKRAKKRGHY
tara:strand:- start:23859 stop:24068 length:210 start_codon:yes stop_codon:yes gene_type:complete